MLKDYIFEKKKGKKILLILNFISLNENQNIM